MDRSGFHEAPEATAPDFYGGPMGDPGVDWLLEQIEFILDDYHGEDDVAIRHLYNGNFRPNHVITDDLRAAIGRVVHMIRADENVEITDADLALLAKVAEGRQR